MPELSRFFGIIITIFYNDHGPPHVHVRYNESEASLEIGTGQITKGFLPTPIAKLVRVWLELHHDEVLQAWKDVRAERKPDKIKPLRRTKARRDLDGQRASKPRIARPYPSIRLVEWLETNLVRIFFSTGLIKEVRLPTRSAKHAKIVFHGMGLDIDGKGYEMSGPRLATMRGKTIRKAGP